MVNTDIFEQYVDRVYTYAVKRTFSEEEAAELSQEILYTAIRELPKLRDESRFEAWLWGVADNVTKSFSRKQGRHRAFVSYGVSEDLVMEEETDDEENEEVYASLRRKIAMLSAMYRDIIILYYYDGLSTKQISDRLCIPEGTVTWRLSEARRKLKKECVRMEVSALKPKKFHIGIYGSGEYNGREIPFPSAYINDALSQNILYYCYESSCSIEELSKLCGVPAYYIEDRVDNLLKREAVIEKPKGKYRTDFIIWSDKYGIYCEENAEKILMPVMDKMIAALCKIAEEAADIDFYKAEKSANDLFYLYGVLAFEYVSEHYCKLTAPKVRTKYDGYNWRYIGNMETGNHKRFRVDAMCCANRRSGGSYKHIIYSGFTRAPWKDMMYDDCINACEDILNKGTSEDVDVVAHGIQTGYIKRGEDGKFVVLTPAFTKAQKSELDSIADKYLSPLMEEYSKLVDKFIAGYKKLFPKHLSDDADRMCKSMFKGMYAVIIEYAQRTGVIELPAQDSYCDVLVQYK